MTLSDLGVKARQSFQQQAWRDLPWARLAAYARAGLLVLCAWYALDWGTRWAWQLAVPPSKISALELIPSAVNPTSYEADTATQRGKGDIDKIAAWHLFGEPPAPDESAANVVAAAERIKATVVGIIYSSNVKIARAVIRMDQTRKQQNYRVGDALQGSNATVKAIAIDHVLLQVGDKTQTLPLYKTEKDKEKSKVKRPEQIIDNRGKAKASAALGKYRNLLNNDIGNIRKYFRFSAVKKNKEIIGYRVSAKRDHSSFGAIGFRNGDVVTAVDGIPLNSLYNLQKVMRLMENGGAFSFYVMRNNSYLEILAESS